MLHYYDNKHFINSDGSYETTPNTIIITQIFSQYGLELNNSLQTVRTMTIFPSEYFCPKNPRNGVLNITSNTACIHHFDGSWLTDKQKKYYNVSRFCERKFGRFAGVFFKIYKYAFHPKELFERLKR